MPARTRWRTVNSGAHGKRWCSDNRHRGVLSMTAQVPHKRSHTSIGSAMYLCSQQRLGCRGDGCCSSAAGASAARCAPAAAIHAGIGRRRAATAAAQRPGCSLRAGLSPPQPVRCGGRRAAGQRGGSRCSGGSTLCRGVVLLSAGVAVRQGACGAQGLVHQIRRVQHHKKHAQCNIRTIAAVCPRRTDPAMASKTSAHRTVRRP